VNAWRVIPKALNDVTSSTRFLRMPSDLQKRCVDIEVLKTHFIGDWMWSLVMMPVVYAKVIMV